GVMFVAIVVITLALAHIAAVVVA
ncbi:hypothetical protein A2U01_0074830, partial [Trifolium medium]|nr:hypothetical protein [Trifolium medium]